MRLITVLLSYGDMIEVMRNKEMLEGVRKVRTMRKRKMETEVNRDMKLREKSAYKRLRQRTK